MIKILNIKDNQALLNDVIDLADANNATLGFLPKRAIENFAHQGRIFVAVDEDEHLLGYLLYNINRRANLAYIVHLCVDESQRGTGVAESLFEKLKRVTKSSYKAIRVRCRRDYGLDGFWSKLGFIAVAEKPGRSKHGSTLTIWWFDHGHRTLFTFANEQESEPRLKVAIDANIFYELQKPPTSTNHEAHSLLADWLQESVELCLTHEIFNEINRNKNSDKRKGWRLFARTFTLLDSPDDKFQKAHSELQALYPKRMSKRDNDKSDLRQLARSIAADVQFFVTRDKGLLKKSDEVFKKSELRIIEPSYLIIHQDALMREAEYQPARLSGSLIKIERVNPSQSARLADDFFDRKKEKKAKFRLELQPYLVDPHNYETKMVTSDNQALALIIYGRQNQRELDVPLFRVLPGPLLGTLARHLVLNTVELSSSENRVLTKITDSKLSSEIMDALQESRFAFNEGVWIKANIPFIGTSQEFLSKLVSLSEDFASANPYFQQIANFIEAAHHSNDTHDLLKAERALWPAKFTDIDIPTFVVPIKPIPAMNLFDQQIASQTLFGGDPNLILKVENVYYRTSRPKILSAPARILWYVSQGQGKAKYQGVMSIRACSYLDEVIIDKPKVLFSQFKRLGVYEWKDVYKTAKNNIDQSIMAFRFSNTELFSTPIHKDSLQDIWKQETGRNFHIQGPISIPNERFFRLYKMGTK